MKKLVLVFSFLVFGALCVAFGFYFGKMNDSPIPAAQKLSDKKQSVKKEVKKSTRSETLTIPVLGCAIKHGRCECYGRETPDFSFMGDGVMEFELSVCENYIKHSGGDQHITIHLPPSSGLEHKSDSSLHAHIAEKLKKYPAKPKKKPARKTNASKNEAEYLNELLNHAASNNSAAKNASTHE